MYSAMKDPFDALDPHKDIDLQDFLEKLLDEWLPKMKSRAITKRIRKAGGFPDPSNVKAAMDYASEPSIQIVSTVSVSDGASLLSGMILLSEELLKNAHAVIKKMKAGGGADPQPVWKVQVAICFGLVLWGKRLYVPAAYKESDLRTSFFVPHLSKAAKGNDPFD